MNEQNHPLTYKTSTLIEQLQAHIDRNEKKRADAKKKVDDRNKKTRDAIVAAIDNHPSFLVWLTSRISDNFSDPGNPASFAEHLDNRYPLDDSEYEGEEDSHLKRLVRIYQNAEDETVQVGVYDDVFQYL